MAQLESLMKDHFIEYASYFILDRAIPELRDGFKPVQRRLLHTLFSMHDGRYHKVANVIGDTMKLHPHGDSAIGDALVVLANKDYFIDRQGNFGNVHTGHPAAAARYIECRLTPLAVETLFNDALTEFVPSYDGRNQEPVCLPSKLPVVLMLGTEGIAVGMSTRIMPHNLAELWEAQIAYLQGKKFELVPDFQQGGLMDVSAYDDGRGKIELQARIEKRDDKHIVITEIPFGTTTESLIASMEAAAQKGRVKIASIDDFTTDKVEIEVTMPRGIDADEVLPQLLAYTDCSVSVSSNMVVIRDRAPVEVTVSDALKELTDHLREQIKAELEHERGQLIDRQHWLTLEQIFIEKRVYKKIETAKTAEAVRKAVVSGMKPHESLFIRPMVDEDVGRLLELRIRRISAFDIEKNRSEIAETKKKLKEVAAKLKQLTRTTIAYVQGLLDKFGDQYPRRTHIGVLESVDKKAVARQSIKLSYDKVSGFFGSTVKGELHKMSVSEYDLILGLADDGTYRIMTPPEKLLFTGKLLYCRPFDPDVGVDFTVVYRDKQKIAFAKRIHIEKFIRNKEYQLVKDRAGKVDLLLEDAATGIVELSYTPAKRQRLKGSKFDLSTLEVTGTAARGTRLAAKPVSRVKFVEAKPGSAADKRAKAVLAAAKAAAPERVPAEKPKTEKPKPASKQGARKKAPRRKSGRGEQGELF